jgi:ABC-type dipeptide/oligopeptide/nickel transport system ATPase component
MILTVKGLAVGAGRGENARVLLKDLSIDIPKNKITTLIGESGAGKTIFAKVISALLPENVYIMKGAFTYDGTPVDYHGLKAKRGKGIFYTPQNAAASLNPVLKIKNQLNDVAQVSAPQVKTLFETLGFYYPERILNSYPFELSGGENQRCLLAMALLLKSRLLILDEPVSSMDHSLQHEFINLIHQIKDQYNLTVLLVTHNLFLVKEVTDSIYIIYRGEIIQNGRLEDLFSNPEHHYTREIINYWNHRL